MRSLSAWSWLAAPEPRLPVGLVAPPELILYSLTLEPISKVFWPPSEMDMEQGAEPLAAALIMSAERPPQPVGVCLSGMEVCHWTCWSLWLKSCGGEGTLGLPFLPK